MIGAQFTALETGSRLPETLSERRALRLKELMLLQAGETQPAKVLFARVGADEH